MGKSTLLTNLAGVYSEVAAYEFTTLTTVPGVIRYKGAKIQVCRIHALIVTLTSVLAAYDNRPHVLYLTASVLAVVHEITATIVVHCVVC